MKTTKTRSLVGGAVAAVALSLLVMPAALAATSGGMSVTDRTDDPVIITDSDFPAANETDQDGQVFWDGGTFHLDADTSGSQVYRQLSGTVAAPAGPCADGQVTLTASATFENLGPNAGSGYSGELSFADGSGTRLSTDGNLPTNAAVGSYDLTATATVSAADLTGGDVYVSASGETFQNGTIKAWDLSGFDLSYSWVCPPVPTNDTPIVAGDTTTTFDPLANDEAESSPTADPADLDPTTVQLHDPGTDTWGTTLTTDDGTYTVDPVTGEITFDPVDGFDGEATVPVTYRVSNTDGGVAQGVITVNGDVLGVPVIDPLIGSIAGGLALLGGAWIVLRRRTSAA